MKKTITKPDGSIEVVEGSPEEIADYERKLKNQPQLESPKQTGPGLLTDEVARQMSQLQYVPLVPKFRFDGYHLSHCEMMVASRGWFSIVPPRCTCGADTSYSPLPIGWEIICGDVTSH